MADLSGIFDLYQERFSNSLKRARKLITKAVRRSERLEAESRLLAEKSSQTYREICSGFVDFQTLHVEDANVIKIISEQQLFLATCIFSSSLSVYLGANLLAPLFSGIFDTLTLMLLMFIVVPIFSYLYLCKQCETDEIGRVVIALTTSLVSTAFGSLIGPLKHAPLCAPIFCLVPLGYGMFVVNFIGQLREAGRQGMHLHVCLYLFLLYVGLGLVFRVQLVFYLRSCLYCLAGVASVQLILARYYCCNGIRMFSDHFVDALFYVFVGFACMIIFDLV